jgi:hypothetical protein
VFAIKRHESRAFIAEGGGMNDYDFPPNSLFRTPSRVGKCPVRACVSECVCALGCTAEAVERIGLWWKSAVVFYLSNLSVLCMHACTGIWEASNKSLNKRSGHGRYSLVQYYFFSIQPHVPRRAATLRFVCGSLIAVDARFCFFCLCARASEFFVY